MGEKPEGWLVGFRAQTKALSSELSREMGSNTGLPAWEISSSEGGPHLPMGSPPAECYQLWHLGYNLLAFRGFELGCVVV